MRYIKIMSLMYIHIAIVFIHIVNDEYDVFLLVSMRQKRNADGGSSSYDISIATVTCKSWDDDLQEWVVSGKIVCFSKQCYLFCHSCILPVN